MVTQESELSVAVASTVSPTPTWEVAAALEDLLARARDGTLLLEQTPHGGWVGTVEEGVVEEVRVWLVVEPVRVTGRLSPRELQIARLVADGATNRAIGTILDISSWTVSTHLRRIFSKLDVGNRAEMVAHLYGRPQLPAE